VTTSITYGQLQGWLLANYGSANGLTTDQFTALGPDGTRPVLRYAFNLSSEEPPRTYVPGSTLGGFPAVWFDASRNRLIVEFLRRKASTSPGIAYGVQFTTGLSGSPSSGVEVSTSPLDAVWERVRYEDPGQTSPIPSSRFCRATVTLQNFNP
jgi:hypothetical protein